MKLDESIKCPHCGKEDSYVFYDNTEMIDCHYCKNPMDIKLKPIVEVIATLPNRECDICGYEFLSDSSFHSDKLICPKCGWEHVSNWSYKRC